MIVLLQRSLQKLITIVIVGALVNASVIRATDATSDSEDMPYTIDSEYFQKVPGLIKKYKLDDEKVEEKVMDLIEHFVAASTHDERLKSGDEEKESQAIIDAWRKAGFDILTMGYDLSGKPGFQSGHSFVLWHPELPHFVIKFEKVIERLIGLEKLQEVQAKKNWSVVLPKKYIIGTEEGPWFLLAEKLAFLDPVDAHTFLENNNDKLEELKLFLYLAGYCDANRGNIKIAASGNFSVVDTDDTYFREPSTLCGATRRLSKYVLGYKDPVCEMKTDSTSSE